MALSERQEAAILKMFVRNVLDAKDEAERRQLYLEFENSFKGTIHNWNTSVWGAFLDVKAPSEISTEWMLYDCEHKVFSPEKEYTICEMSLEDEKAINKILVDEIGLVPRIAELDDTGTVRDFAETGFSFVAKKDDRVVGVVMAQEVIDYGPSFVLLNNFAVAESEQGRGLGRLLMNHLIEIAKDHHMHDIKLHTHKNLKAYDIYRHMGFEEQSDESVYMTKWFL